jgi:Phasin protein
VPLKDKGHPMESKGRRASRAGPVEATAQPDKPVEAPVISAGPADAAGEPLRPAGIVTEASQPTESSDDLEISAAAATLRLSPDASVRAEGPVPKNPADLGREVIATLARSQAALARGLEALSAEMAGLALSGMDTAARTANKMLGIRTLSDAIEVNAGFTCTNLDALVGGSARLSELGIKLAAETSEALFAQFGRGWITPPRRGS